MVPVSSVSTKTKKPNVLRQFIPKQGKGYLTGEALKAFNNFYSKGEGKSRLPTVFYFFLNKYSKPFSGSFEAIIIDSSSSVPKRKSIKLDNIHESD